MGIIVQYGIPGSQKGVYSFHYLFPPSIKKIHLFWVTPYLSAKKDWKIVRRSYHKWQSVESLAGVSGGIMVTLTLRQRCYICICTMKIIWRTGDRTSRLKTWFFLGKTLFVKVCSFIFLFYNSFSEVSGSQQLWFSFLSSSHCLTMYWQQVIWCFETF